MLNKDFKEFVALLNAVGVEYLVVGGYALAAHGRRTSELPAVHRISPTLRVWTIPKRERTDSAVNLL